VSEPHRLSRRKFLRWALGVPLAAAAAAAGGVGYAFGIEPETFHVHLTSPSLEKLLGSTRNPCFARLRVV
jgi:hypothetical protein